MSEIDDAHERHKAQEAKIAALEAERDALLAVIGEMREVFSCVEVHEDMIGVRDQSGTSFWVNTPKPKGWHAPLIPFLEKIRGLMQSKPTEALARLKDEVAAKVWEALERALLGISGLSERELRFIRLLLRRFDKAAALRRPNAD